MIAISSGSSSVASGARHLPALILAMVLAAAPVALPVAAQTTDQAAELPESLIPADEPPAGRQTLKNALKQMAMGRGGGNGNQFCAIMVNSHGQLSPSPEQSELSSMAYGGRPGQIEVVASNSSFSLSIDTARLFAVPCRRQ